MLRTDFSEIYSVIRVDVVKTKRRWYDADQASIWQTGVCVSVTFGLHHIDPDDRGGGDLWNLVFYLNSEMVDRPLMF
jgi:hypothetical protein